MKKIVLINALAMTLVACGGGGGGGGGNTTPSSDPASSTPSSVAASSVASSTASSTASSVAAGNWSLVWSDDFDGANIDTSKWSFEKNCYGGGNNELQCYTDRVDNAFVLDGKLHIVAKKETFSGQSKGDDDPAYNPADTSTTRDYTSARLRSKGKGDWTYGRMEMNAKLPKGQGIWPAFWMLPTEWKYGGWPSSGEIDIMEAVNSGGSQYGNKVHGTLHYGTPWAHEGTSYTPATNVWDEFHTYAIEWEAGTIRWYVDGVHYQTQISKNWFTNASAATDAPFDQKFHLLLNLAVGGGWPGNPDNTTVFPQEMIVEYVKVFSCDADPVSGKGCASNVDSSITPLPGTPKVADGKLTGTFNIFVDSVDPLWNLGVLAWDNSSGVIKTTIVDSDVPSRGKVIDFKYGATNGVAYIQASTIKDASAFSTGGNLEFDVKVINYGSATELVVKADCKNPCSSGDIPIGKVGNGAWETVTVPISKFVTGGLNLARVDTPFIIFPKWDQQTGVELQVDNVRWVK